LAVVDLALLRLGLGLAGRDPACARGRRRRRSRSRGRTGAGGAGLHGSRARRRRARGLLPRRAVRTGPSLGRGRVLAAAGLADRHGSVVRGQVPALGGGAPAANSTFCTPAFLPTFITSITDSHGTRVSASIVSPMSGLFRRLKSS